MRTSERAKPRTKSLTKVPDGKGKSVGRLSTPAGGSHQSLTDRARFASDPTDRGNELCGLLADRILKSRPIPPDHYWSPVAPSPGEAATVAAFIEQILEAHAAKPITYSLIYTAQAFDVSGAIARGDGFKCATFMAFSTA